MFEIVVSESSPGRFAARLGSELLGTFRTPLLSAARELVRRGVSESAPLAMRHEGQDFVAMTTTVGAAARSTENELDSCGDSASGISSRKLFDTYGSNIFS